jgi:hypothetical protein
MKKLISLVCALTFIHCISLASPADDSLISELNTAIQHAHQYDAEKMSKINTLKKLAAENSSAELSVRYNIDVQLYEEYKYFNFDSSLKYTSNLQRFAAQKSDAFLIADAKLKYAFILLSAGMFKETFDALNSIEVANLREPGKAELYSLMARYYFNLSEYTNDFLHSPGYNTTANSYLDSALAHYPTGSFDHDYYEALKFLKKGEADDAQRKLSALIARQDLSYHERALATSTMGGIFIGQGQEEKAKPFLIEASIADIKSSTKETLALQFLAGIIYKEGLLEDALLYIEKANVDATFYNARLRKVQIGAVLPLIEGDMIRTIRSQKKALQAYLISLSVVVLLLAGLAVVIFMQVKKLQLTRKRLSEANLKQQLANEQLSEANALKEAYNNQLQEMNDELVKVNQVKEKYNEQLKAINKKLLESNKIKEEYIGYYFKMDTEFMARVEKLITQMDKKLLERKWDEMKYLLKSVDMKKEKEELLRNFDKVFIRLFPDFVTQFNSMFNDEDRAVLKDGQLLNPELRIFALIRLGITENEKIAEILDYSINTIYAKKTKIRSKAIVSKDEFERRMIENTTMNL